MPEFTVFNVVVYTITLVGFVASVITIRQYRRVAKRITWRMVGRGVLDLKDKLVSSRFSPELIVGIGRGGAVVGALLSGCLGHVPLLVIDRKYEWIDGKERKDAMFAEIEIKKRFERVLLVAGELHTGDTAKLYKEFFEAKGEEVRIMTLVTETYPRLKPDYFSFTIDDPKLRFPWHLDKNYKRDSKDDC